MIQFDPKKLDIPGVANVLKACVVPRPIIWVSTCNQQGQSNLAPFSFFTIASIQPPVVCITQINPSRGGNKDTVNNLADTGECVLNFISHELLSQMCASAEAFPPEISEFDVLGIETVASTQVAPPGVKQSRARFECTLREIKKIAETPFAGTMVFLNVVAICLDPAFLNDGEPASIDLDAVGKLAGDDYVSTRERFSLPPA